MVRDVEYKTGNNENYLFSVPTSQSVESLRIFFLVLNDIQQTGFNIMPGYPITMETVILDLAS